MAGSRVCYASGDMLEACLRHDPTPRWCALSKAHAWTPPPGGGRKTRHELAPPTWLNRSAHEPCGANSFGASGGGVCGKLTPTRNAIGLSRPTTCVAAVADGRLSPWRSVLPPPGGGVALEPGAESQRFCGPGVNI